MVFSDPVFLYAFLPCVLLVYWIAGRRNRIPFFALSGILFYLVGGQHHLLTLAVTAGVTWASGELIVSKKIVAPNFAKFVVSFVIVLNVGSLVFWKYSSFLSVQMNSALEFLNFPELPEFKHALPLAISFFTFQAISYVLDVYRGTCEPAKTVSEFVAYMAFFPHLIAGPIVRYTEVKDELRKPSRNRLQDLSDGFPRFFWGLAKKILVADQVGAVANAVFALPTERITAPAVMIGAVAYTIQIYFDFSGYSDMAIGLARMMGVSFRENFEHPYSSHSITDFWRRWHISLSLWFRDYVYIPLGGNRGSKLKTFRNLGLVFLLTGFWHGANWTFIIWGLYHGTFLVLEKLAGRAPTAENKFVVVLRRFYVFCVVVIGWIFFRADSVQHALTLLRHLILPDRLGMPIELSEVLTGQRILWISVGSLVFLLPRSVGFGRSLQECQSRWKARLRLIVLIVTASLSAVYSLSSAFSPFLYFNF